MQAAGVVNSKREARRLVEQQGVRLDSEVVGSVDRVVEPGEAEVLQVGRRRFVRLTTG
jgi:tyrosyl-tRNA synthetase